jgi:hypothetical protein
MTTETAVALETRLSVEELALVREAAYRYANGSSTDDIKSVCPELGARWRAAIAAHAHPDGPADRLIRAFAEMYPALEAEGGIDSWPGYECRSVLCWLIEEFPREEDRFDAMHNALGLMSGLSV